MNKKSKIKKIFTKENLIKASLVGFLFFTGSFLDRIFRLEQDLLFALEAGIKQGLFNFVSALFILHIYIII